MGKISPQAFLHLWAKADKKTGTTHPLICHLLDCGNTLSEIWNQVLTSPIRNQFCRLFNQDEETARTIMIYLAAMHDIGKASPAFQGGIETAKQKLEALGLPFPSRARYTPRRHDLISYWCFEELAATTGIATGEDMKRLASLQGGHHGFFQSALETGSLDRLTNLGGEEWKETRLQIQRELQALVEPPGKIDLQGDDAEQQAALVILTGLIVACDWLASDEAYFPFESTENLNPTEYQTISQARAKEAIQKTGWGAWQPEGAPKGFTELFKFDQLSPVQQKAIEIADDIEPPFLAILEAPTGEGKTEAAFYLADYAIQSATLRGLYIAMPTMATSNQMYSRTAEFLNKRYPGDLVNLQLTHSQAKWDERVKKVSLEGVGGDFKEEMQGVAALSWFLPKKKALLAPFGVGTVDQALMSVLKTKHFFLRLFGLAHKAVIFDEVHAYDVYMSTLFLRLLEWLKMLGCSVLILSATLPRRTKEAIAAVYAGDKALPKEGEYPGITLADRRGAAYHKIDPGEERLIRIETITKDEKAIVDCLAANLEGGGCAAVICNTVGKAQSVYEAIKAAGIIDEEKKDEALLLFHARFPYIWREKIEKKALDLFGKNSHGMRPRKAIAVATQVIEQSLDLDFDLMVSELAPIDLLIQRAGRLQRHAGRTRPEKLARPRLAISGLPAGGEADFGVDRYIYDADVLLGTAFALQGKEWLRLPEETSQLIERVYDPLAAGSFRADEQSAIRALMEKSRAEHQNEVRIAHGKLIPRVEDESILRSGKMALEEDHPVVHRAFQALTRLMQPSISLVCLNEVDGEILTLDDAEAINLKDTPNAELTKKLLQCSVNVTNRGTKQFFRENVQTPQAWMKNAGLRGCFPAIFKDGVIRMGEGASLVLSNEMGLYYRKEED